MLIKLVEDLSAQKGDYLLIRDGKVKVVTEDLLELVREVKGLLDLPDKEQKPKEELKDILIPSISTQKFHYSKPRNMPTRKELLDRRTLLVAALSSFQVPATAKQLASYAYGPKLTDTLEQAYANDCYKLKQMGLVESKQTIEHGKPVNWYRLKPGLTNEEVVEKVMFNSRLKQD